MAKIGVQMLTRRAGHAGPSAAAAVDHQLRIATPIDLEEHLVRARWDQEGP
jgi:hypothetical protein